MELLNLVSANNSAGNVSLGNVIGATTFSAQTASLRGLGGGRTLVLVNGKRLTNFAGEIQGVQGVNLAAIPFSAIERVEVLKDGASAVYGSDAIGGVINFILRQDYQGAEATIWGGTPTRSGGGDEYQFKASAGFGDLSKDRYNFFLSGSYDKQKPLLQSDRNFSNHSYDLNLGYVGVSGNTFPGHISTGGIGTPELPELRAVDLRSEPRQPLLLRPGDLPRRRDDPGHRDHELLRLRAVPDHPELAGVRHRACTRRRKRASSSSRCRSPTSSRSPTTTRSAPPTAACRASCCRRPARSIRMRWLPRPVSTASR